jgi:hypothetical protein
LPAGTPECVSLLGVSGSSTMRAWLRVTITANRCLTSSKLAMLEDERTGPVDRLQKSDPLKRTKSRMSLGHFQ